MRNTRKLVALILALMLLSGAPAAFASTYVSDPVSPSISGLPSGDAQPEGEATPAPEATPVPEATPAPEVSAEPTPAPEGTDAVVATENENGSVNIRAAASIDSEIIGTLMSGMSVTVLGVEGDWTHVRAGGIEGYVSSKYLKVSASEDATPVQQAESDQIPEEQTGVGTDLSELIVEISSSLDDHVAPGETVRLTSRLIGFEGMEYTLQWQYNDGSGWKDVKGATGATYEFEATLETVQYKWRLAVTI